jgi:hypothetical protein
VHPSRCAGPSSTAPTLRYPYFTGHGKSPSWNGARITAYWLGGTRPSKTSVSVPRLTPEYSVRTSTSPGPVGGSSNGLISPAEGPTDQNARAARDTAVTLAGHYEINPYDEWRAKGSPRARGSPWQP